MDHLINETTLCRLGGTRLSELNGREGSSYNQIVCNTRAAERIEENLGGLRTNQECSPFNYSFMWLM